MNGFERENQFWCISEYVLVFLQGQWMLQGVSAALLNLQLITALIIA